MIWITENLATIIVSSVLILIVALVIVSMVKRKKNGTASCGGNCSGCPMGSSCHKESDV